jgi:hypothetical protein
MWDDQDDDNFTSRSDKSRPQKGKHKFRSPSRTILQMDVVTGKCLGRFPTFTAVTNATGMTYRMVHSILVGERESMQGWRFCYEDDEGQFPKKKQRKQRPSNESSSLSLVEGNLKASTVSATKPKSGRARMIEQIDSSAGQVVQVHRSSTAAGESIGTTQSMISRIVSTSDSNSMLAPRINVFDETAIAATKMLKKSGSQMVEQIDLSTGQVVRVHESYTVAGQSIGTSRATISRIVKGERASYKGWTFRRVAETAVSNTGRQSQPQSQEVEQIEVATGHVVTTHVSLGAAARAVKCSRHRITRIVHGKHKNHDDNIIEGYTFRARGATTPNKHQSISIGNTSNSLVSAASGATRHSRRCKQSVQVVGVVTGAKADGHDRRVIAKVAEGEIDDLDGDAVRVQATKAAMPSRKRKCSPNSNLRGITKTKNSRKWAAQIAVGGKSRFIGTFDCKIRASHAYEIAREYCEARSATACSAEDLFCEARKAALDGVIEHFTRLEKAAAASDTVETATANSSRPSVNEAHMDGPGMAALARVILTESAEARSATVESADAFVNDEHLDSRPVAALANKKTTEVAESADALVNEKDLAMAALANEIATEAVEAGSTASESSDISVNEKNLSAFDGLNEHFDDRIIAAQTHEIATEVIEVGFATIESSTEPSADEPHLSVFDGLNEHSDDRKIAAQTHEIATEVIEAGSATIEAATEASA